MTIMENKILDALGEWSEHLAQYDAKKQVEYDEYVNEAERTSNSYEKRLIMIRAENCLIAQHHGYDFVTTWMNVISGVMYKKTYYEWHSAQAGKYGKKGHGSYATTELTEKEEDDLYKVFDGLVRHGLLKLSKSGKKAVFKGGKAYERKN